MPLPAALAARLAKRGIISKRTERKAGNWCTLNVVDKYSGVGEIILGDNSGF